MEPVDTPAYRHDGPDRTGVLLVNLGTPAAPTAAAVRPFLREFLSDRRVVDLPRLLWLPILHGIILRIRPRRAARAYQKIWTEEGSPLLVHTRAQAAGLSSALAAGDESSGTPPDADVSHTDVADADALNAGASNYDASNPRASSDHVSHTDVSNEVLVEYAFRYSGQHGGQRGEECGKRSIADAVDRMREQGVRRLLVLPLFPQYSGATTGSVFDALADKLKTLDWTPALRFVTHYHDHPAWIAALAAAVREHWAQHGRADRLLLSYHGIPVRYRDRGDPYFCQCHKTTRLLAEALGLAEDEYAIAFQSRFGREEWLRPYTDELLAQWAGEGVGSVQVMCPGFASDCLETLEEIAIQYRQLFLDSGGADLQYIPALNAGAAHIEMLAALARDNLVGWE